MRPESLRHIGSRDQLPEPLRPIADRIGASFADFLERRGNLLRNARWLPLASISSLAALFALSAYLRSSPHAEVGPEWQPPPGISWQWQLQGEVRISYSVDAYDIDGFDNSAAKVD